MRAATLKRAFDVIVAVSALLVLSPLLIIVVLLVRWRLGRPVLFRQERLGIREKPFQLIKFRTMTDARGASGELLPDADRLPTLGRRLRASSVDELPELWNVLRGEMSLVGPRPLPAHYAPKYRPEERARHQVRPGITGWAQVRGRNAVDWDERFAMDVWYVHHRNFWLDLRIIGRTVLAVLTGRGISAQGEATMYALRPEIRNQDEQAAGRSERRVQEPNASRTKGDPQ